MTLAALTLGLVLGAASAWLALQRRIDAAAVKARSDGQVEVARVTERNVSATEESALLKVRLGEVEARSEDLRSQLEVVREERAHVAERASRVPILEAQIADTAAKLTAAQEDDARSSTQLDERTAALVAMEKRLTEAIAAAQAERRQVDALQATLKEEAARVATLAEQATRLPEAEQARKAAFSEVERLRQEMADLRQTQGAAEATETANRQEIARLAAETRDLALTRDQLVAETRSLASQLTEVTTTLGAERTQAGEKLSLLKEAKEQLSLEFKALAGEILEVNSKRLGDQHQADLGQLLTPLKTRLTEFQGKVEEVYVQEGKDRAALGEQVKQLLALNHKLSQEAHDLTSALRGSSKAQGTWGEIILERVLESSGLRPGHDYDVQESHLRADGTRAQPDVVVHLPEDRHLVIDAKVSLTAYEEYSVADGDLGRETALRRHVDSVRGHVRSLSERNYQTLYTLKSLDFVLLFVPIEPAFMLAVAEDAELWQFAWTRNVLLVSPSTLLFVLRTVAHLWRQEQQSRNAQEIAKRGAELYDKLVGFVEDLQSVGNRLGQAQAAYDDAYNKFTGGKGNVVRQAEMLKGLGVKPTKTLPTSVLERATVEQLTLSPGSDGDDA